MSMIRFFIAVIRDLLTDLLELLNPQPERKIYSSPDYNKREQDLIDKLERW